MNYTSLITLICLISLSKANWNSFKSAAVRDYTNFDTILNQQSIPSIVCPRNCSVVVD